MQNLPPTRIMNEASAEVEHSSSSTQPVIYKDPILRVRVRRDVLEGENAGPFRKRKLTRLRYHIMPKSAVRVEPLDLPGLSASVLYAAEDSTLCLSTPFAETKFASGAPNGNLVFQDSPFEIRVVGMLVKNYDRWSRKNELLMYSVQTDPKSGSEDAQSLPFIHFDHRSDSYQSIERANTFIPVPASKSFVTGSYGKSVQSPRAESKDASGTDSAKFVKTNRRRSVNVLFKMIELDTPSETVKQSIEGIDSFGGVLGNLSAVSPTLGLLSPAIAVASSVTKQALDSYAKPDNVISIDMDFLLANRARVQAGTAPFGEYLRYGYYFFLSEPVEAKLYASVLTPKNVRLMLRRMDVDSHAPTTCLGKPVASRKFFPLTEVSYIVVRVCEPIHMGERRRVPVQMAHAKQLEQIFSRANSDESSQDVKSAIQSLGRELGFIEGGSADEAG